MKVADITRFYDFSFIDFSYAKLPFVVIFGTFDSVLHFRIEIDSENAGGTDP